jgi:hypothetical protein
MANRKFSGVCAWRAEQVRFGQKWCCVSTVRGHPRIVTIGDGAAGGTVACSCAPASQVAQDGLWMRPGNGWFAGECLVARVVAWLVAAWRRRQTQIRLAESPRMANSKSVWNSRSCTISRSPSQIGETERCYPVFRQLNDPQAEGTRPRARISVDPKSRPSATPRAPVGSHQPLRAACRTTWLTCSL